MKCPKCQKTLIVVERHAIELDHCLSCKGFWFDEGEFHLMPEALGLKMAPPDFMTYPKLVSKERSEPCPRCHKTMDKVTPGAGSSLVLDRCPIGDGLWFDAGELAHVVNQHLEKDAERPLVKFLGEVFGM